MTAICHRCKRPRLSAAIEVMNAGRRVWICLKCLHELAHRWLVVRDTLDAMKAGSEEAEGATMEEETQTE